MNGPEKIGIIALVLDAVAILLLVWIFFSGAIQGSIVVLILLIINIVLSIYSLREIKKYKGRMWIPILAIIISVIVAIPALYFGYIVISIFLAFMPQYFNTFEVPMELTLKTSNFEITPSATADANPVFIFVDNNELDIPEDCIPEFGMFGGLQSPEYIGFGESADKEGYPRPMRGKYDVNPIECSTQDTACRYKVYFKFNSEVTRTFLMKFDEKNNQIGFTKKALESGSENARVTYFYAPGRGDIEKNRSITTTGCAFREDLTGRLVGGRAETVVLEIKGITGKKSGKANKFVCVKKSGGESDISDYSQDGCKFYEITYDFEVSYNIDTSKGRTGRDNIPIHI